MRLPSEPTTLEYAPPPPWHRRRRARRILIGITLLLTAGLMVKIAPRAWWQTQMVYWQRKCMNYEAPGDQIVVSRAQGLRIVPAEWFAYYGLVSPPGGAPDGTIFLHERISPKGNRRLVAVEASVVGLMRAFDPRSGALPVHPRVRVIQPGNLFKAPREVVKTAGPGTTSTGLFAETIFAGQPDPNDASHFTINYLFNGKTNIIDGWLLDNDDVLLEYRSISPPPSSQPLSQ